MPEKPKLVVSNTALKQEPKSSSKPASDPAKEQTLTFEKATAAFQKKDFGKARALFAEAATGPALELAHSAQMYMKMCQRRMGEGKAELKSPDDFYTLGVSLLNRGDLDGAQAALERALQRKPDTDHYHYALALCAGQRGDMVIAASHLRRAIDLQPSNRIAALNDPDFHSIAQNPTIREILNGERSNAG
jgi:tetratricopeptide (TPR) repeat protein